MNAENFPDEVFRNYVSGFDKDEDGSLSDSEISAATEINLGAKGISSLKGIEYFTGLEYLDCSLNVITELDVSACKSLVVLYCNNNMTYEYDSESQRYNYTYHLASLNVTGCTALEKLYCNSNFNGFEMLPQQTISFGREQ